jgi:hypothetical protein
VPKPIRNTEVFVIAMDGATPPDKQRTTCILPKLPKNHKVAAEACAIHGRTYACADLLVEGPVMVCSWRDNRRPAVFQHPADSTVTLVFRLRGRSTSAPHVACPAAFKKL